jgi:hypothetical protein
VTITEIAPTISLQRSIRVPPNLDVLHSIAHKARLRLADGFDWWNNERGHLRARNIKPRPQALAYCRD